MNNKTILGIAFLFAGTLLTAATTAMVPAYAGGDDDGNKQKVEDESAGAIADCDNNDVERAGFECFAIAEIEEGVIRPPEPEPEPETCQECFERFFPINPESLEDFCENVLEPGFISEGEVRAFLTSAGADEETQDALIECLEDVGIIFEPDM